MDWQPPPELCEKLDLESLNNYRIAIGAERIQCRIEVNDPNKQINRFDDLTNQTYRLTRMIEKYGSKETVEKLYHESKLDDLKPLLIKGIYINFPWTSDLLGQYISRGDHDIINLVIDRGAYPFAFPHVLNTHPVFGRGYLPPREPLIEAVKSDQFKLAESLLLRGYLPDNINSEYDTPLIWAVFQNKMEFIELLLNYGADINHANSRKNRNPLSLAVMSDSRDKMDLIKYLTTHGAKPDYKIVGNNTPFTAAVAINDFEIVNLFIGLGYTIVLYHAVYVTNNVEMIKLLMNRLTYSFIDISLAFINASINHGIDIMDLLFQTGQIDQVTLDKSISVIYGNVDEELEIQSQPVVEKLLSFGADINGCKDIRILINAKSPKAIRFLSGRGADPNLPDKNGLTPLGDVLRYTSPKPKIFELIQAGADVNMKSTTKSNTKRPLNIAVDNANLYAVDLLLEFGADPNLESSGLFPLMLTFDFSYSDALPKIMEKYKAVISTLISSGADVNFQNHEQIMIKDQGPYTHLPKNLKNKGQTILMYHAFGNPHLVPILLEAGAEPNVQDSEGNTALHYLLFSQKYKSFIYHNINLDYNELRSLLEYGADPSIPNNEGTIPEDLTNSHKAKDFIRSYYPSNLDHKGDSFVQKAIKFLGRKFNLGT